MEQLVKITDNDGKKAVSAKELYDALGLDKTSWARWYRKNIINNEFAIGGEDWTYLGIKQSKPRNQDFVLTIDFAKKLAMLTRTSQGDTVRKYFIEIEKSFLHRDNPLTPLDLFRTQIKVMEAQETRIKALESAVTDLAIKTATRPDYFSIVGYASKNGVNITLRMAQSLGLKARNLCIKNNMPIDSVPDPRFGRVGLYPALMLQEAFISSGITL